MVKVSKGVGITTTNPLEVPRRVVESEIGSFCATALSTQRLPAQCSEATMSGIAICLLSCSREASVSSSIQETPRVASHNGSQEGSCIPVNLPLSLLELHFISSSVFYLVLDKWDREGMGGVRERSIFVCWTFWHYWQCHCSYLGTYWEQGSLTDILKT